MKFPIDLFHLFLNLSFFGLMVGMYFFGKRLFFYKGLAAYLVIALTIVRVYGGIDDIGTSPQVTPLRLDLWLLVLALGFWKSYSHWIVAACLAFLVMFHHAFGVIYTLSYVAFIFVLFMVDALEKKMIFVRVIGEYCSRYWINLFILLVCFLIYQVFLSPDSGMPAFTYRKYNLGFMPIDRQSFYWFIPIVLSFISFLLWKNRGILSKEYFQTGIFILLLALGNSFYFYGRSHENNIINIAAVLLLALFLCLDLIHLDLKKNSIFKFISMVVPVVSAILVGSIAWSYSGKVIDRVKTQFHNILQDPWVGQSDYLLDLDHINAVTRGSAKVIILSINNDFKYYHAMGIAPQGYFCFSNSWILKKEYMNFLNSKLAAGYYLIMPVEEFRNFDEILRGLKNWKAVSSSRHVIFSAR